VKKLQTMVDSEEAFVVHGHDAEQWAELKKHHTIMLSF
jgi:hypothetical protein